MSIESNETESTSILSVARSPPRSTSMRLCASKRPAAKKTERHGTAHGRDQQQQYDASTCGMTLVRSCAVFSSTLIRQTCIPGYPLGRHLPEAYLKRSPRLTRPSVQHLESVTRLGYIIDPASRSSQRLVWSASG
jgi:hypothetical protein